ncbi:MAG: Cna B-type domain-containing protein, partial [Clostridiales bacterium]|nr:Cna B-type domain-containing protein [Clostridiales bacterium]
MKKLLESKKFLGITSLILATSLVVGTIAIRRSKNNGIEVGIPQVNAAGSALLDYDSSSQVNYSTILGRAVDYGILTKNLVQTGHMQSTFATSLYDGGGNASDVNMAGSAPAQFIIADMTDGSRFMFEKTYKDEPMNYVIDTTVELASDPQRFNNVKPNLITMLPRTYDKATLNANIDAMIGHIQEESETLLQKPAVDVDDVLILDPHNANKVTLNLDDDAYEGATVYFNVSEGSALLRALAAQGENLTIKKRSSTVVVFNVLASGTVNLGEYVVTVPKDGEPGEEKIKTTTDWTNGDESHNLLVDKEIARKIIWNLPNASVINYDTTAGVFLVPNPKTVGNMEGPSAGWIASAGTTNVKKAEFHYVYHDRAQEANVDFTSFMHFATKKAFTKDLSDPKNDENVLTNVRIQKDEYKFTFVEKTDDTFTNDLNPLAEGETYPTYGNDEYGKVVFPSLSVDVTRVDPLVPLHRYFVIKEVENNSTDGNITMSDGEIDIDLEIRNINGIIHYYIRSWHYATADDKTNNHPYKVNGKDGQGVEMSGTEFSLGGFYNEYKYETGSIKVTKSVTVTNDPANTFPSNKTYEIAVKKGAQYVQNTDGLLGGAAKYFEISAGRTLEINNLKLGEYTVEEKDAQVPGFDLTTTYTPSQTATIASDGDVAEVTVNNAYEKLDLSNKASIKVTKSILVDGQAPDANKDSELINKEFKFKVRTNTNQYVADTKGNLVYDQNQAMTFSVKAGEEIVLVGLDPQFTYTVEEMGGPQVNVEGYKFNDAHSNDGTPSTTSVQLAPAAGEEATAGLVNSYTRKYGYLKITKMFVEENPNNPDQSNTQISDVSELNLTGLMFHVTGPQGFDKTVSWEDMKDNNGSYTFPDAVPEGRYTIEEYILNGNDQKDLSETGNDSYTYSQTIVVGDTRVGEPNNQNNPKEIVVKNLYKKVQSGITQGLIITKQVEPSNVGPGEFSVVVTTTINGTQRYCKFDEYGNFISADTVSATTDLSSYYVKVTPGGTQKELKGLPLGKYRVQEIESDAQVSGQNLMVTYSNQEVTLDQYSPGRVQITNTYSPYSLVVNKSVQGTSPFDPDQTKYEFAVKKGDQYLQETGRLGNDIHWFSVMGNDTVELVLPSDGEYTVIERFENWEPEGDASSPVYARDYNIYYKMDTTYIYDGNNGATSTVLDAASDIYSGEVTIQNKYTHLNSGDLKITKAVDGDTASADPDTFFKVGVTLDCAGQYEVEFTDADGLVVTHTESGIADFKANVEKTFTIKAGWTVTIKDITSGTRYVVSELDIPNGYTHDPATQLVYADAAKMIQKDDKDQVTLTNTFTVEKTEATIVKVWDDSDNRDGKRPNELKVYLSDGTNQVAEFTLSKANNWTATKTDLPKYVNGQLVTYTWSEDTLPNGYSLTKTEVKDTVTTFTNSYQALTMTLTVKKVWEDKDDQDGIRPASLTVKLLADGQDTYKSVTLSEENDWEASLEDLPVNNNGTAIVYTWEEAELPTGYALTETSVNGTVTTLKNKHTTEETDVSVVKVWDDANNQDGYRPADVSVHLLANGKIIDTVTLSEENDWSYSWTKLDKKALGAVIDYTVAEEAVAEYTTTITKATDGSFSYTITNSHTTEETDVSVEKVWEDANNQDGYRPADVSVHLQADGKIIDTVT